MVVLRIPTSRIRDWDSFHKVFAKTLRFPRHYGHNENAFLDLLYYPDALDVGVDVEMGDTLCFYLDEPGREFARRCPAQYAFLVHTLGVANQQGIESGEWVALALAFS
jgi:hypothetical protein